MTRKASRGGVEGYPLWISVAPEGDRIAVTYWSDGDAEGDRGHDRRANDRGIRLAILSAEDHRILYDEPAEVEAHVMLEDGELIGMEGTRMGRYETDPLARVGTVPGAAGGLEHPSLSRDARTLLVMADDGTALLYDTATGIRIGEPFRPTTGPSLRHLCCTSRWRSRCPTVLRPDGLEMALSMPEGVVVWDIDPEHQFEYACRIAGRDLTENEWRTYLAALGEPQSTCGFELD